MSPLLGFFQVLVSFIPCKEPGFHQFLALSNIGKPLDPDQLQPLCNWGTLSPKEGTSGLFLRHCLQDGFFFHQHRNSAYFMPSHHKLGSICRVLLLDRKIIYLYCIFFSTIISLINRKQWQVIPM